MLTLLVGLLVVYYSYWIYKWRNPKCKGTLPPGSMGLPIIGETLQFLVPSYSLDIHPFFKKRFQRYGPIFRSNLVGQQIVVSGDQEFNNYILNQEGKLVELWYMDSFSKLFELDGNESKMNATGHIHKYIRSLVLFTIGSESLREKLLPRIENFINKTLYSWLNRDDPVDVRKASSMATCHFAAKIFFSLDADRSWDKISDFFSNFSQIIVSFPLNIPGSAHSQHSKGKKQMMKVLERIIKDRKNSDRKHEERDVLDLLLNDMGKEKFVTEQFIRQFLFICLLAATNSPSITIALLVNFLSANPLILEELTVEHENILKNRKGSNHSITWDEYKSMTFTHQVINETLRMSNVVPGLIRKAVQDIPYKGYTIPAGWGIVLVNSTCHMNSELYEDPFAFNPWRWKDLDPYTISKNFSPFGGGGRQCAGADYSRLTFSIFIHVLVTKYRWTVIQEGKVRRNPFLGFKSRTLIKLMEKRT